MLGRIKYEREEWMSKQTWKLAEVRGYLKGRIERAKTRNQKMTAAHSYHKMNREVKRSCKRDKRERIDSIAQEVEKAAEMNDMKKVYDTIKLLCGRRNIQSKPAKDKNGTVLTNVDDQPNR